MGRGRWGSRLLRPGQAGDGPRGGHQRDQQPPPHGVQGAEGGSPSHKTSRTQTQADAPVPAEVTNSSKHLRHRTNLFLKHFFSKKGRNHPTSSKLPTGRGAPNLGVGWSVKGSGALGLSDSHSDCGRVPGEGSSWLPSSSGRALGKPPAGDQPPSCPLSSRSVLPGSLREPSLLLVRSVLLLGVQQGPWSRPSAGAAPLHCPDAQGEATGS